MTAELIADFKKEFSKSTVIHGLLRQPTQGFSITVLFGPSGGGKSTILRCLAGLERPEEGAIHFGEQTWFHGQGRIFWSPQERDIGYLFQEYALFPHLRVEANITYGLVGMSGVERSRKVREMLDLFGLTGMERRYPHQLSGGQQQRVALARVLVRRPRLLLLDEPFSALDAMLREEIRPELRRVLARFGVPVILVTHERSEVISLADRVVVVDGGRVRQTGTVQEVFNRPADGSVARVVGMETVVQGRVVRAKNGLATVLIGETQLVAVSPAGTGTQVQACIRAEEVILQSGEGLPASARNRLEARVQSMTSEGALVRVALDAGFPLTALVTRPACEELGLKPGVKILALIKAPAIHLIPRG